MGVERPPPYAMGMMQVIRGYMAAVLAVLMVTGGVRADDQAVREQLITLIHDQVRHANANVSNEALAALRRLRDPRLRPIFVRLSADASPDRVIGALLGMADLEDPPRVDVVRMAELSNENARAGAVGLTLRLGYLDPDGLERVANWPNLGDTLETLLMAELLGVGRSPSPARLAELSRSEEPLARTLALLLEGGLDAEGQHELADKLLGELQGQQALMERVFDPVLLALRRAEAVNAAPFVKRIGDQAAGEMGLEREVLRTLATLEPEAARQRWIDAYRSTESLARRFSLGLAAIHTNGAMGSEVYTTLIESGNPTLGAMGRAALAMLGVAEAGSGNQEAVDALIALLDTNYEQATTWTVEQGRTIKGEWRIRFAQQLLRWAGRNNEQSPRGALLAYEGARQLAGADPAALRRELDRIAESGDDVLLHAALRGIIEAPERGRVWSASNEPKWTSRQTAAIATICAGLFDLKDELDQPESDETAIDWGMEDEQAQALTARLIEAATVPGSLSEPSRVQAAWLALVRLDPGNEAATKLLHRLSR